MKKTDPLPQGTKHTEEKESFMMHSKWQAFRLHVRKYYVLYIKRVPFGESIDQFFDKLSFMELENKDKGRVSKKIKEDAKVSSLYWSEIVLSSIIATFGLLQNSVAVIIGAMLIAPLLRPIQAIAFSIVISQSSVLWKSIRSLLLSMIISIGLAYVCAMLIPIRFETSEILARTSPNILDLFIATGSAIVALLSLKYEKLSESVAGVAMAASLMPPLAVVGIELSLGNYPQALGSLFLFVTNLFAIIVVGMVMFIFYGYAPHVDKQKNMLEKFGFVILIIIGISIPLTSSLQNIAETVRIQKTAKVFLQDIIDENIPNGTLSQVTVNDFSDTSIAVSSSIRMPEGFDFLVETQDAIKQDLGAALEKDVTLDLEIIRTASILSEEDIQLRTLQSREKRLESMVRQEFSETIPEGTLIRVDVARISKEATDETDSVQSWAVQSVVSIGPGQDFSDEFKETFRTHIAEKFGDTEISLFWTVIQEYQPQIDEEPSLTETFHNEQLLKVQEYLNTNLDPTFDIENLQLSWQLFDVFDIETFSSDYIKSYTIQFDLMIPQSVEDIETIKIGLKEFAANQFDRPMELKIRIFRFDATEITSNER